MPMVNRFQLSLVFVFLVVVLYSSTGNATNNGCTQCHPASTHEFASGHAFAADNCTVCHGGNAQANSEATAHENLYAFPGDMDTAERACGGCHAQHVTSVDHSLMHTGRGIVSTTRKLIDGESSAAHDFQSLGHSPADSVLRKLCASCHLGQAKTHHSLDPLRDRGGGCLACHINDYPEGKHPALSKKVSDARCFGCHSRSGRISLSYTGLAEIHAPEASTGGGALQLADGRRVEQRAADIHYTAGMACIDCHTATGVMGDGQQHAHQGDAVDIACDDCHRQQGDEAHPVTGRKGTPLTHIDGGAHPVLQSKITGRSLPIPYISPDHGGAEHDRLECASCHSQWAPQCFGCHMSYDAEGEQWDHIDQRVTQGRWQERRWHIDNALPALGVNEHGRIEPFVPGMIMTVEHPQWPQEQFLRVFAPLSPHTIGPARNCVSCHRSSRALGLGEGEISATADGPEFKAAQPTLRDGLPADAWTGFHGRLGGAAAREGLRPFTAEEMRRILAAPID